MDIFFTRNGQLSSLPSGLERKTASPQQQHSDADVITLHHLVSCHCVSFSNISNLQNLGALQISAFKGLMKKEEITVFKYSLSHYNLELCQQVFLLQQNKMRIVLFELTPIAATVLPAPSYLPSGCPQAPSLHPRPVALSASPTSLVTYKCNSPILQSSPVLKGLW